MLARSSVAKTAAGAATAREEPRPAPHFFRPRLAHALATWFGCGLIPVAPGTFASAAAVLIGWLLQAWLGWGTLGFSLLAFASLGPAIWVADRVAAERGSRDPDMVVVDEVVGQWVALVAGVSLNWATALLAFLVFRLFDVWKPPPVRQLERLPGGLGIVADDVMAGVYTAMVLYVLV